MTRSRLRTFDERRPTWRGKQDLKPVEKQSRWIPVFSRERQPDNHSFTDCKPRKPGGPVIKWSCTPPTEEQLQAWRGDKINWPPAEAKFNKNIPTESPGSVFNHLFPMDVYAKTITKWTNQKQQEDYEVRQILLLCLLLFFLLMSSCSVIDLL